MVLFIIYVCVLFLLLLLTVEFYIKIIYFKINYYQLRHNIIKIDYFKKKKRKMIQHTHIINLMFY
jgi:hypothetical protein